MGYKGKECSFKLFLMWLHAIAIMSPDKIKKLLDV